MRVRGEREAGGVEGQPGVRDGGEGAEGKDINGQMGDKRFKDEGGAGVQHYQRGPNCILEIYMSGEYEEEVTVLRVGTRQGSSSKSESCQEL